MNDGTHYYHAFIGHKNLEDAQQRVQRQSRSGLPIVQDLNQFEVAWSMPFVKNRVTQILRYIFQVSSIQEQHQKIILEEIDEYVLQKKSDKDIYELVYQLRESYKKPVSMMAARANGRALEIASLLPETFHVKNFLDVGCAEGSIPITLRKVLNIGTRDAHGCDVRDIVGNHDFTFRKITSDGKLPYEDNSMSLVLSLMAIHHIHDPACAIREMYRVLEPGGYLLIREHDCEPIELALVLDIVHGLYSQVIRDDLDPHDPSFSETYFAKYLSAKQVVELVTTNSFVQVPIAQQPQPWTHHAVDDVVEKNPLQTYYVMFQKV
jgi:SAM-dependent methyltransferase